jgi:hypothetical protein
MINHRLLVFILFQVLSDPSIPLSLLLIAKFTNRFVILLLGFQRPILEAFQLLLELAVAISESVAKVTK